MKERYVLLSLYERLISYSLCSQMEKDQNNFRLDLSEDEIRMSIDLIDKRIEELESGKENA